MLAEAGVPDAVPPCDETVGDVGVSPTLCIGDGEGCSRRLDERRLMLVSVSFTVPSLSEEMPR